MKHLKVHFLLVLCVACFAHCSFENKIFSDYQNWIPNDFDAKNTVLLVQNPVFDSKKNEPLENYLSKHYPGKYVVTTIDEIKSKDGKFADTDIYRYAFVWGSASVAMNSSNTYIDPNGHFYDRAKGILHPTTKKYNNYGSKSFQPFINSIAKYIENSK